MNPFYFGDPERPLYGVYHPPRERDAALAVVLCYPIGAEYMRAHRAFRQLTNFLTRDGVHVLRFDYFGTGDSAGSGPEVTLDTWKRNVGTAIEEARDSAGVDSVSIAGLRFGGTLALLAATGRDDVDHIVLWDPVEDGSSYLEQSIDSRPHNPGEWGYPDGTVGLGGFPLVPEFRQELQAVKLSSLPAPEGARVDIVVSSEEAELQELVTEWSRCGSDAHYRCVPSEGDWSQGDRFGSALIPQAIIKGVVETLVATART